MQKTGNITLFFECFQEIHLVKDPFLVPYYLGKMMNYDVSIVYPILPENKNLPNSYRGASLIPVELCGTPRSMIWKRYAKVVEYLSKNAKKIDVFITFFGGFISELLVKAYKKYNPDGKVYVKLDINPDKLHARFWEFPFDWSVNHILRRKYFSLVDIASCETTRAYEKIKSGRIRNRNYGDKLIIVPNGIDEEEIQNMGFGESDVAQKEKIMLTVGRLGVYDKNTEMLLQALHNVEFQDWKFIMVGPVDANFQKKKEEFINSNPQLSDKVIWTGAITDRKKLYELLNRSKVFVFTSRFESFGLVLIEALRFSNYLVSTPVGAAPDIIKSNVGQLVPINDVDRLSEVLQGIIDNNVSIEDAFTIFDFSQLSWETRLQKVVKLLKGD